ncbi:MAG: hypothetical protein HC866_15470 [Leptolyngbyaceae cyanobacterium RU_5_1]|nr:hypothetical protein [Leptolyngbyaceae cyanobacterium RU_5_1]
MGRWGDGEEQSKIQNPKSKISSPPHLTSLTSVSQPSIEVLDELLNLARMGAVLEIQERVTQLERSDSQLAVFAAQVRQLTDSFQVRQLQELLQRSKTSSS